MMDERAKTIDRIVRNFAPHTPGCWAAVAAAYDAGQAAERERIASAQPLFWFRPCRDGLYEGPHHNNSIGGRMLRDEKPGEWVPLYAAPIGTAK